jgi:hypothetical protein
VQAIAKFIKKIIGKIRNFGQAVMERGRRALGRGGEEEGPTAAADASPDMAVVFGAIDREERQHLEGGKIEREEAERVADTVKRQQTGMRSIRVIDGGDSWDYVIQRETVTKEGEEKEESGPGIETLIGQKLVTRRSTGDDTIDVASLPSGYEYRRLQRPKADGQDGVYVIIARQRGFGQDENRYPLVNINQQGILERGRGETVSATDTEKIAAYQTLLRAAGIPSSAWPTDETADQYRAKMRDLVAGAARYRNNLELLDQQIISSRLLDAKYNRVIGEIFEIWYANHRSLVRRPVARFIPASNNRLLQERVADARLEGGTLVENKAISEARPPSREERAQMVDYNEIVTRPVPWIDREGNKKTFSRVRYAFNNAQVKTAWKSALVATLGDAHETDPP